MSRYSCSISLLAFVGFLLRLVALSRFDGGRMRLTVGLLEVMAAHSWRVGWRCSRFKATPLVSPAL
jgi:hypothetical protein